MTFLSPVHVTVLFPLLGLLFCAVYRLYLTPSARFPGPKLAALSYWYEFYYDVWPHQGQYTWKIRDLHRRYGTLELVDSLSLDCEGDVETFESTSKVASQVADNNKPQALSCG